MIYNVVLAFIDILIYFKEHWQDLAFPAAASAIGMVLGKRIGTRMAINYALKLMGIHQESIMEQQHKWLMKQEEARGNVWSSPKSGLRIIQIPTLTTLYTLSQKVRIRLNRRRTKMLTKILKANLSKKLISVLVAFLVTSLNEKFNLNLSQNTVDLIIGLSAAHITLQTIIDSIKAYVSNKYVQPAVTAISSGSSNINWDNITYRDARKAVVIVHDGVVAAFKDFEKNDGSQAYLDAVNFYKQLEPVILANKKPEPVAQVTESQVPA
jgi:hypothetical protein